MAFLVERIFLAWANKSLNRDMERDMVEPVSERLLNIRTVQHCSNSTLECAPNLRMIHFNEETESFKAQKFGSGLFDLFSPCHQVEVDGLAVSNEHTAARPYQPFSPSFGHQQSTLVRPMDPRLSGAFAAGWTESGSRLRGISVSSWLPGAVRDQAPSTASIYMYIYINKYTYIIYIYIYMIIYV